MITLIFITLSVCWLLLIWFFVKQEVIEVEKITLRNILLLIPLFIVSPAALVVFIHEWVDCNIDLDEPFFNAKTLRRIKK